MREREFICNKNTIAKILSKAKPQFGLAFGIITLLCCSCENSFSQWTQLVSRLNWFRTIYFLDLPGPPRIGFVGGSGGLIMKTTDGGATWIDINLPQPDVFFPSDFFFKDSLNGWLSTAGDPTLQSGCYRTTDGGNTWSFLEGSQSNGRGIYFNAKTNGIFLASWLPYASLQSFDNGLTWSRIQGSSLNNGFAFNDSLNGAMTGQAGGQLTHPGLCMKTSDGGLTWTQQAFDSECWQPLAIKNSQTQFVSTDYYGVIYRTDDLWNTWKEVSRFSLSNLDPDPNLPTVGTGSIFGDLSHLFVQVSSGAFISIDTGHYWKYLCGMPSRWLADRRFYVKYPYLYVSTLVTPETSPAGYIWMLNLDSLYNYQSKFKERIDFNQIRKTAFGGDTISVQYSPLTSIDTAIGVDSMTLTIRYDSNSLDPVSFIALDGWKIVRISKDSVLRVMLADTSNHNANSGDALLTISYRSFLSSQTSKIYLDSVRSYGHRIFCDCDVSSLAGPDSVEIDFQYHCGDSVLSYFLATGKIPLTIESVTPNPATNEITVAWHMDDSSSTSPVQCELFDPLGREVVSDTWQGIAGGDAPRHALDVSGLPSGVYYLRVAAGGFVVSRRVVVER